MTKSWSDVAASPAYQQMSSDQQSAAKDQYFNQVVAPQLDPNEVPEAKKQFESQVSKDRGQRNLEALRPQLPEDKPVPTPTFKSALESIGTSTALGGALGMVSPEVLTLAGLGASFIPDVGPAISSALIEAGTAARGARLAAAAGGALSGGVSETAGQVAEAAGAGKPIADVARLGAGMATPGVGALASKAKGLYGVIAKKFNLVGEAANVTKATATLRQMEDAGVPMNAAHQTMQHGADQSIQDAQRAGDRLLADARQRAADVASQDTKAAAKILDDGKKHADQMVADARKEAAAMNKASGNRMATAGKVVAQAEPALRVVGQPKPISDIGKELQGAVQKEHQTALNQRSSDYNTLKAQRDDIVKQKEAAGQTVSQTSGMKGLKDYIDKKTSPKISPRPTTEPGVLRVYGQVKEAIDNPSFGALDQVRRKLGDVLKNRDVEGYAAIGKDIAGELYSKITDIQKEFVGADQTGKNLQQMMQENYHDASIGLRKFVAGTSRKTTALDRVDPERFAADPSGVPGQFFSSQRSVQDLKELTGDSGLVQRAGSSYVAGQLRGMSAKQVTEFAEKNHDWMREVPGLEKSVDDYAKRLGNIEKAATRITGEAKVLETQATGTVKGAAEGAQKYKAGTLERASDVAQESLKTQQRILEQGQQEAKAEISKAEAPATGLRNILQGGERPEAVRDLLLHGKPEQTRLASRILSQTPGGQKALEGSVRQITAGMTPATLQKEWAERIKPMLTDGNMLPKSRMEALTKDVEGLLKAYSGKPPITLVQRHIYAAIGSLGANYIGGRNEGD